MLSAVESAKMASEEARRLAGSSFSRIRPEIFKTSTGKVLVEDELLNFIVVKMRTMSHDEIVLLITNNFSSERIESSKKVLFEVCPNTSQRCVAHKGAQKDINNVKMCLKVLNECGDNIPRFVSHYLDDLPPISFNHIDASALLTRIEQLSTDITCMKKSIAEQTNACEDLRVISACLDTRITAMEKQWDDPGSVTGVKSLNGGGDSESARPARSPHGVSGPASPAWNLVVRNGRRSKAADNPSMPKPRLEQASSRRKRITPGIVGTGIG